MPVEGRVREDGARARVPGGRVALILPARDEEDALPLVLAELPRPCLSRLIVVDNGSRDGTARVAAEGGAEVVSEPRAGYGRACLAGIAALEAPSPAGPAWGAGDVVAFLDADHSDYPEDLPAILAPVLAGEADLVLGSRVLGGADMRALLPQAWLGNRLACGLMRILFGARYTDLGPFRALSYDALRSLGMRDPTFGWTIEMQLKAHAADLRVREVPVRYRVRIGRSKITGTVSGTLRAGAKILGWIFAWRLLTLRRVSPTCSRGCAPGASTWFLLVLCGRRPRRRPWMGHRGRRRSQSAGRGRVVASGVQSRE